MLLGVNITRGLFANGFNGGIQEVGCFPNNPQFPNNSNGISFLCVIAAFGVTFYGQDLTAGQLLYEAAPIMI